MNFYTNVHQRGNYLFIRGVKDGKPYRTKVPYKPTMWISGSRDGAEEVWSTLTGDTVYEINPGTIFDCKLFAEKYEDVEGVDIYETPGHVYQFITENFPGELRFDPQHVSVFTVDIETETEYGFPEPAIAGEVIQLITVKDTRHSKIVTWGLYDFDNKREDVEYHLCGSESALLRNFLDWWQQNYPDAVTGWNSSLFDITYLYNRMCRILGDDVANKMSPWNHVFQREVDLGGRKAIKTSIAGIASLDYLDLYKKFTYSAQESYKLDYIAWVELGERKLENPGSTFKDFYTKYWQTFVDYNIRDVELVDKLDDKMKLIDLALTMAYAAKVNYEDVFSPVKTWDVIIYNYLNERKIVVPQRKGGSKSQAYEGAYVKDPLVGKHNWCCSFDLNSLYPHLIMQYNMSPETITGVHVRTSVDELLEKKTDLSRVHQQELSMAANGWCFRKDKKGLLPTQMQLYYDKRVIYKKDMLKAKQMYADTKDPSWAKEISRLNNLQMAMKILLNSAYGAMGNAYFRYFDVRIAEGITTSGQLSIRWIANKLNEYFDGLLGTSGKDRIVLIDTDSVVLTLDDLIQKVYGSNGKVSLPPEKVIEFMDRVAEDKIQPFIDKSYQELADYMNAYDQKMQMKRENLVDTMISVSKKRYVMSVYNSEGVQYKEPQLKIMGLQMVKSSTPAVIRTKLKDSLQAILRGNEADVHRYVADVREQFNKFKPEEIAFPRSINDVSKYHDKDTIYRKSTPIHVRGALLYNHHTSKRDLTKKYPLIREGDKIKFVYLKKPNPFHEDCISFIDKLPEEFDISKYVDYDTMFEKTFIDAIQNILDSLGWSTEKRASLEAFF
jgi:DNA polymerase elongation subunit (family B)